MFSKNCLSHDPGEALVYSSNAINFHNENGEMLSHDPGEFKVHDLGQSFYIHDTGSVG